VSSSISSIAVSYTERGFEWFHRIRVKGLVGDTSGTLHVLTCTATGSGRVHVSRGRHFLPSSSAAFGNRRRRQAYRLIDENNCALRCTSLSGLSCLKIWIATSQTFGCCRRPCGLHNVNVFCFFNSCTRITRPDTRF